jgi:type II secretory pathway pseudopilin PulG
MKEETVVAIVVGLGAGVIGAFVGTSQIRRLQEQIHDEELAEKEIEGFQRGYDSLAKNPTAMRHLLDRFKDPS